MERENRELREEAVELQKKLATSRRRVERLRAERNQHNLKLAMVKSEIDQLIKDPTIPSSMVQSLKLLRHSANFSSTEGTRRSPPQKRIKLERDVEDDGKLGEHVTVEYVELRATPSNKKYFKEEFQSRGGKQVKALELLQLSNLTLNVCRFHSYRLRALKQVLND